MVSLFRSNCRTLGKQWILGEKEMSNKTFLIKMDADGACDYREYTGHIHRIFFCSRTDLKPCGGDLDHRPAWCPLIELREEKSWDLENKFVWVEK
jgi:hypothetical protein